MYITTSEVLKDFVQRAQTSNILAIDTEFLREKTYYARLCLLQMATDTETVIIDPFEVGDLSVLLPLMENENIVKVFHAGIQDLEILYRTLGVLPRPVFDTQIAATLLGHTQHIGYAPLVYAECNVVLKKTESFTDWSRRPLSRSQLKYAADDVIYLPKIYRRMKKSLEKKERIHWLEDDFISLSDPQHYEVDKYERFRHLKRGSQLSRKQLAAAREFCAWREEEAQRRDIPRKWVIGDEQIVEACKREPRTVDNLFMVRGIKNHLTIDEARTVVSLLVAAFDAPKETWPDFDHVKKNEPNVSVEVDAMSALVRLRSREYGVAYQTLASHDELARLARGYRKDLELLKGWRKTLVGDELVRLLSGSISLYFDQGELKVADISHSSKDEAAS